MKNEIEINRSIQVFLSTVYSILQSTGEVHIERIEETFKAMEPVIHENCGSDKLDVTALVYASMRLPSVILSIKKIILGQSEGIFSENGILVSKWDEVSARARRRRYMADGQGSLAVFIASKSDIDDILPAIISFQIEWNKIHTRLAHLTKSKIDSSRDSDIIINNLGIDMEKFNKMKLIWGNRIDAFLNEAKKRKCRFAIQNLEASFCRYRKETDEWWAALVRHFPDIEKRPVYFVSSNTHSLINIFSGFAGTYKNEILTFMESREELQSLCKEWEIAVQEEDIRRQENLLYYLLKKFINSGLIADMDRLQEEFEKSSGIYRFSSSKSLDVPAQIIDLKRLAPGAFDRSLQGDDLAFIRKSNALILNIDYPLGRTAYFILTKIAERVPNVLGVYVIGKAASLTADCGDILIPEQVYDQHTQNTYTFDNCLAMEHIEVFLGGDKPQVFDKQKAITVLGTYIQNRKFIDSVFNSGFTDLEMESGPYLSAIYEMLHPKRHPENDNITYRASDIELGIAHYVSDNPMRGKKLGDSSLSREGIGSTYAVTIAVANRILELEKRRVGR